MKEKIKQLLRFIGNGWRGGLRGKIGVVCILFATFMFARLFYGEISIQHFIMNTWELSKAEKHLSIEQKKLALIDNHIELLSAGSQDFVEELSHKYLNMGDPKLRILK